MRDLSCGDTRVYLEVEVRRVHCRSCGAVKQEKLPWLADNPFYTKRFAFYVGRRCRSSTILDVARELRLDWKTVKSLEMEYMREQLRRAGTPGPKVIGIDEISIGRGHNYRIVVSDLIRGRPIWFGGKDRSEASLDEFFAWLGLQKCRQIRLAVMDMWKAFRQSTLKAGNAPQAGILYDKFHILKHLNEALDKVRKSEYARLSGKDRRFITYGSLVFTGGFGNPRATFSYKSGGRPQSSRRRVCTSVNGDNRACVCPLTSTTLTLIVFITPSSNSALGRAVWRPG